MTRKRRRYSDVAQIPDTNGRNGYTPDWRTRHEKRRKRANVEVQNAGLAFASLGGWLRVSNDGHHWQVWFPKGTPRLVQWWPASAKLVIDEVWRQGIHVHRWQQVFQFVRGKRPRRVSGQR